MRPSRTSSPIRLSSFSLSRPLAASPAVQHVREGLLEALFVHAAFVRVDRVGERVERLGVAGGPLHRHLDLAVIALGLDGDRLVHRLLALGQVLHEVHEAAVGLEGLLGARGLAFVEQLDLGALVQERQLAQPLGQRLALELQGLHEDLGVGPEPHPGAGLRGGLALRELAEGLASLVGLAPREPVAGDLDLELLAERVHDRDADAVQAAGDGIAAAAELAAGVQHREDHLDRGAAILGAGDRLDRDATSVVEAADRAVLVDRDHDLVGEAGHGLVDRVVDDLEHEMVQTAGAGGSDVHTRSLADRFESFEDLDVAGVIAAGLLRLGCQRASDSRPRGTQTETQRRAGGVRGKGRTELLTFYPTGPTSDRERSAEKVPSSCGFAR